MPENIQFQGSTENALDCIHLVHAPGSRLTEWNFVSQQQNKELSPSTPLHRLHHTPLSHHKIKLLLLTFRNTETPVQGKLSLCMP
jgi:hypothetical protein